MSNWSLIKEISDRYALSPSYTECTNNYNVWVSRDNKLLECKIWKSDPRNADQIDFEDNYKV